MKLTTDLAAHGHEHEFSVMFKQMAAQVLGLRVLRTELAHSQENSWRSPAPWAYGPTALVLVTV